MTNRTTPLYRLIYFNTRGAAELTRYILAVAEVPYDDIRYPMQATATGFGTSPEFLRDQRAGSFDINMGQLPLLQVLTPDGKAAVAALGQSHAINRFLALRHGLLPDDEMERAHVDGFYEAMRDLRSSFLQSKRTKTKRQWMKEELPIFCDKLERSLTHATDTEGTPWLFGTSSEASPTLADIALYSLLGMVTNSTATGSLSTAFDDQDPSSAYQDSCPRLTRSIRAMSQLDSVVKWEQERPDTFS